MGSCIKNKSTQGQVDAIINEYSPKNKVLDLLYTGPANTPIRLTVYLQHGISLSNFAYVSGEYITLPEYRNGNLPSKTVKDWKNQMNIVKIILSNFINNNPDYFRKVSKTKYAVTEKFILDILFHNIDKGFDALDIQSIFNYIIDFDNFSKIVETFYIPHHHNETPYTLRRKFKEVKPYKYSKRAGNK